MSWPPKEKWIVEGFPIRRGWFYDLWMESGMQNKTPGAYVVQSRLFFRLLDGSSVSCECIGEPHASQVVALFERDARMRSMFQNARNILRSEGFLYADRIDQEFPELVPKVDVMRYPRTPRR